MSGTQNIKKTEEAVSTEVAVIDEQSIRDKIYVVRGVQVMLDFELAEIYGYSTRAFNQQVKNNIARFDDDFRFQITRDELDKLVRSKKLTSRDGNIFKGQSGGTRYLPWCFTESGLYMLMTVLKGDLAIRQSKTLIRIFRAMKDYIVDTQGLAAQRDLLRLSLQTTENTEAIRNVQLILTEQQRLLVEHDDKLINAFEQISETVKKSEISPFMLDFSKVEDKREYLFLNGQPAKADETYIDIYSRAKRSVYIVDNYVSIKTLRLLQNVQPGVSVIIFTDNLMNQLHASDYADFRTEFPNIQVSFRKTGKSTHDRFIVLDHGTSDERIFHCGASSKDAGVRLMTAISEMTDSDFMASFDAVIQKYLSNPQLLLR